MAEYSTDLSRDNPAARPGVFVAFDKGRTFNGTSASVGRLLIDS
jgi:hypothetical protein